MYPFFCNFITTDFVNFECQKCGRKLRATEPQLEMPKFLCLAQNDSLSTDLKQTMSNIQNVAQQSIQNTNSDYICTEEQIAQRYSICSACEYFQNGVCNKCGCPLQREVSYASKLVLKHESCPINKWTQIVD